MPAHAKMSPVDTAWLRMDRPNNLMQIVSVMLFDGDLDFDDLRRVIEQRMLAYDRFRQVVRHEGTSYVWVDHDDFDLDQHLRRVKLPKKAGKDELQRYVADLASTPLNPTRPLWEMQVVDTTMGGQALITRIHHCIADGIALVGVILSMTDEHAPLPPKRTKQSASADSSHHDDDIWSQLWRPVSRTVTATLQTSMQVSTTLWGKYFEMLGNPNKAVEYARLGSGMSTEAAKLLVMPNDSRTRFKGTPGSSKSAAWSEPIPLPEIKAVGKTLGCSVNDLLMSAVAGALRGYLGDCGDEQDGVEIRAMVPVNLRGAKDIGKLGNRFGIITVELPAGIANPLERLYETRRRMQAMKHSYQPALTLTILGAVGAGPKLLQEQALDFLANKATAVMTNVPGPTQALKLAGATLKQPFFWVPQSGNIGMGVSILSYNNQVQFGLITDSHMVPDPERIVARFEREFHKLLMIVLMEAPEHLDDPALVEAHHRRACGEPG